MKANSRKNKDKAACIKDLFFAVGLDVSATCTGVSVEDIKNQKHYSAAFAQSAEQEGVFYKTDTYELTLFECLPINRVQKYIKESETIIEYICNLIPVAFRDARYTKINFEHYVFKTNRAENGYNYVLHEIGGILKYLLAKQGFSVSQISVPDWKCTVVDNGHATKYDIVKWFSSVHFDILKLFGLSEHTLAIKPSGEKSIPSPISDICDSKGLATEITTLRASSAKRKQLQLQLQVKNFVKPVSNECLLSPKCTTIDLTHESDKQASFKSLKTKKCRKNTLVKKLKLENSTKPDKNGQIFLDSTHNTTKMSIWA